MNRLDKIKMYKEDKDKKALDKVVEENKVYYDLMGKITELYSRIDELIETANACIENGIEIDKYRKNHSSYDDKYTCGTFVSNGITHRVGFIQNGYRTTITHMGIVNGGACGSLDFYTDGINICSVHEDTKMVKKARIEDMKKFLKGFDEFEKAFYEYVDRIVG